LNTAFVVAKSGDRWFTSKAFTEIGQKDSEGRNMVSTAGGGQLWVPLEPQISISKNSLLLEWRQYSESASVDQLTDGRNMHQCFDYFRHIGWNVSRYVVESGGEKYDIVQKDPSLGDYLDHPFLPEFLEQNSSKYKVLPIQEDIDGFPCWVLEYLGMDKVWVDSERGHAIRKRVYHWEPGKPRKFSILNQEWKEVAPRLWLPHKQIVDKYASIVSEDSKIWDQVTARMFYEVNEILINDVSDKLFSVDLPVGIEVLDSARGTIYTVTDPNSDPFAGPIGQGIKPNRFVMFRAITIIIGSLMIFIAVWRMLRNKEGK
jgi:hypothetical protein